MLLRFYDIVTGIKKERPLVYVKLRTLKLRRLWATK